MASIDEWTKEEAVNEYRKRISALQYTIGQRERLLASWKLVEKALRRVDGTIVADVMSLMQTSTSERFQDITALLLNDCKRNGYFVEFGACDGAIASNTLTLEKNFGWTGVLAEPATCWHGALAANRSCRIDHRCISSRTGARVVLHEGDSPIVSSLYRQHKFLGDVRQSYEVETVSLGDLLRDHDAPQHVDFLSVDCEGHEMEAIATLDFERYSFGFICIEQHHHVNPERDVSQIFEKAGYRNLFPRHPDKKRPPHMQVSGIDLYFVPANHPFLVD